MRRQVRRDTTNLFYAHVSKEGPEARQGERDYKKRENITLLGQQIKKWKVIKRGNEIEKGKPKWKEKVRKANSRARVTC